MSSGQDSTFEHELQRLDLEELRGLAIACLRGRLNGFDQSEIESAAQDVMLGLTEAIRRRGIQRSAKALLVQICRNVAADLVRARQLERKLHEGWRSEIDGLQESATEEETLEAIRRATFFVKEYLTLRRAECIPIAEAKQKGQSLKDFAEAHGFSHDQVRQLWSRCVRFVLDAIARGRLQLEWPLPRKRRASRD